MRRDASAMNLGPRSLVTSRILYHINAKKNGASAVLCFGALAARCT